MLEESTRRNHTISMRALGFAGLAGILLTVATLVACPSSRVGAETPPPVPPGAALPPRFIEVNGSARLDVPPDRLDLTLTLEGKRASPREAVKQLLIQREQLVRGLWNSGIRREDLVLSQLSLRPSYAPRDRSGREVIDGYVASVTLVATVRDAAKLGDVMESGAALGVTRIHTAARTSKGPEMKKRVREMAIRAAREKAEQMARALGVKVGEVRAVREVNPGSMGRPWYGGLANVENVVVAAPPSSPDQPEKAVAPDAIPLRLEVGVTFAIR